MELINLLNLTTMTTTIDNNQRKFINPFNKKPNEAQKYYTLYESQKVFSYGDYAIYKEFDKSHLYTFKDLVFNNLVGCNKEHLINVANRTEPTGTPDKFLYQRAVETLQSNSKEVKLMRDGIEVLIYKVPTDKDLKIGTKICFQNLNGIYAFLGTITDVYNRESILNYAIDTAIGTYIASELRLIK